MHRRTILAGLGLAIPAAVVGCLDAPPETDDTMSISPNETTPTPPTDVEPRGDCGPSALPLTAQLTTETGEPEWRSDRAMEDLDDRTDRYTEEHDTTMVVLGAGIEFFRSLGAWVRGGHRTDRVRSTHVNIPGYFRSTKSG